MAGNRRLTADGIAETAETDDYSHMKDFHFVVK